MAKTKEVVDVHGVSDTAKVGDDSVLGKEVSCSAPSSNLVTVTE